MGEIRIRKIFVFKVKIWYCYFLINIDDNSTIILWVLCSKLKSLINFVSKLSIFREQINIKKCSWAGEMYISCSLCNKVDHDDYFLAKLFDRPTHCLWVICIISISAQLWYGINVEGWCFIPILSNGDLEYKTNF